MGYVRISSLSCTKNVSNTTIKLIDMLLTSKQIIEHFGYKSQLKNSSKTWKG